MLSLPLLTKLTFPHLYKQTFTRYNCLHCRGKVTQVFKVAKTNYVILYIDNFHIKAFQCILFLYLVLRYVILKTGEQFISH